MTTPALGPLSEEDAHVLDALDSAGALYEQYLDLSRVQDLTAPSEVQEASHYAPVGLVVWTN